MPKQQHCESFHYVLTSAGPKILPVEEPSCKDEESPADYNAGGYLPVKVNDSFKEGRYRVLRKLGWGHFSTVWLVKDEQLKRHSALKVVKSAGRYAETARDEIKLLSKVASFSPNHPGRSFIVSFLDSFCHQGPEASHICIVFEPLGENLLALIERNKKKGVPRPLVKVIAKQILLGLQYLHDECDLVHTDIKPENILISIPDIESHIHTELTLSPSPTSRRVGVPLPPPKSRSGVSIPVNHQRVNSTRKQVQIFDSQPLASPGRSAGLSMGHRSAGLSHSDGGSGANSVAASYNIAKMHISRLGLAIVDILPVEHAEPVGIPMKGKGKEVETSASWKDKISTSWKDRISFSISSSYNKNSRGVILPTNSFNPVRLNLPPISIKIADLGNATPSNKHYTEDIQTRQYRAPEAILGRKDWDARADIWSVACVIFELLTAEYLFDPQGQGQLFTKDDDHMAQIIELLGDFDLDAKMGGRYSRELFDHTGTYIRTLKPWPLSRVMTEKYLYNETDASGVCSFLLPMLATDMRKRARARDLVDHQWLEPSPTDEIVDDW
ncbi:kinase-like domain-containing protein [Mycena floridula]|nr:kinase-like domain-containing protein [Mycena floridula]